MPNSRPTSKNPTIKSTTFMIMVNAETDNGKKLESTMAKPEILPTDTLLGTKKKNTDAATIIVANVMIKNSLIFSFVIIIIPSINILKSYILNTAIIPYFMDFPSIFSPFIVIFIALLFYTPNAILFLHSNNSIL